MSTSSFPASDHTPNPPFSPSGPDPPPSLHCPAAGQTDQRTPPPRAMAQRVPPIPILLRVPDAQGSRREAGGLTSSPHRTHGSHLRAVLRAKVSPLLPGSLRLGEHVSPTPSLPPAPGGFAKASRGEGLGMKGEARAAAGPQWRVMGNQERVWPQPSAPTPCWVSRESAKQSVFGAGRRSP